MRRFPAIYHVLCALIVVCAAGWVLADVVKLKDGTVLDGTILSEDDKQIAVEVELAGGSITRQETVDKSNVVEVVRLTPEQKAERQMQQDYEKAKKYQLDPAKSFPLGTYNQAIDGVFRKFLTQYTNSPYQQEITDKIAQWEAERDTVASGQRKYRGAWMSAAESAKLAERDRASRLLQRGRDYLAKGRYDEAIKQLHILSDTGKEAQLVAEARRLEAESYRLWLASLDREQQRINDEIKSYEERAARAGQAQAKAQTSLNKANQSKKRRMGVDGFAFEATRAESEAKVAGNQAEQLRKQLASVQQFAADLRTRAAGVAASPAVTPAAVEAPSMAQAPAPDTSESATAGQSAAATARDGTAMLDNVVQWAKEKWMILAGGFVIGLWLISRLFTRS